MGSRCKVSIPGYDRIYLFSAIVIIVAHLILSPRAVSAQSAEIANASRAWAAPAIAHARMMRAFRDFDRGAQRTPPVIPQFTLDNDPKGFVASYQPGGPTVTASNPFFQNLGTNGRTCFTCHQPKTGWTISARSAQQRFDQSGGMEPLFRLVDGATCPTDDVSTLKARRQAFVLVREKGLIRIGLAMPPAAQLQFEVSAVSDPYDCTTNTETGLISPTTGTVSVYRRPLPSTNLNFLSTFMWDGREPSLAHQALDATLIHAQGNDPGPTAEQQTQMVNFETGVYTAQIYDNHAHSLLAPPSTLNLDVPIPESSPVQCSPASIAQTGGPFALAQLDTDFFVGINDPLGLNPCATPFTSDIFDLYAAWGSLRRNDNESRHRESVARGEAIFNTKPINITGVAGLNDVLDTPSIAGNCGTCHDTPNVGNHSVKAPLNIGVADANPNPPALDVSGLPVFTLRCVAGPLTGQVFYVTDPGRALITGNCADIGKTKGPILRGLAARAPYFHNGSATTLMDAVNFYDTRFDIGFTDQEKEDLVNFLKTL
jgi:cytochrome c peroxidase